MSAPTNEGPSKEAAEAAVEVVFSGSTPRFVLAQIIDKHFAPLRAQLEEVKKERDEALDALAESVDVFEEMSTMVWEGDAPNFTEAHDEGIAVLKKHGLTKVGSRKETVRTRLTAAESLNAKLAEALEGLKTACQETLLPAVNEAIKRGYKMDTWCPEQMNWAKAVADTDAGLALYREGGGRK